MAPLLPSLSTTTDKPLDITMVQPETPIVLWFTLEINFFQVPDLFLMEMRRTFLNLVHKVERNLFYAGGKEIYVG